MLESILTIFSEKKRKQREESEAAQRDLDMYNRRYTEPFGELSHDGRNNMIVSQNVVLSMDTDATRRNLNVLVLGSGAKESFAEPNIAQANRSYVVTDEGGRLYDTYGSFLHNRGYTVIRIDAGHKGARIPYLGNTGDRKTAVFIVTDENKKDAGAAAAIVEKAYRELCVYAEKGAKYSQVIVDGGGEVVGTFRASSEEESEQKRTEAEDFVSRVGGSDAVFENGTSHYKARFGGDGVTILRSLIPDRERLEGSSVVRNGKARLPVHVSFMLSGIGESLISDLDRIMATTRKYNISTAILAASVSEIKRYEEWEDIVRSMDTVLFLGGTDAGTEDWFGKRQQKEVRVLAAGGAGFSPGKAYSPEELHNLPEDECVIAMMSLPVFRDRKAAVQAAVQR